YTTNEYDHDAEKEMVARGGKGSTKLFITPAEPRAAFYYGWRPDSAAIRRIHNLNARSSSSLAAVTDSLAAAGLPFHTIGDFEDADFSRADSLTRGRVFVGALASRHPGLAVKDAQSLVDQLRA